MEVSVTEKDEDLLFRRSSRKRRKINYKSEKQLRVIVKKEEQTDGKPRKRGRPRKQPLPIPPEELDTKSLECLGTPVLGKPVLGTPVLGTHVLGTTVLGTTAIKKKCRKFKLNEIDIIIEEYIKLGDEDGMKRIINSLQCALQTTPKKTSNACQKGGTDIVKEAPTPVKQKTRKSTETPRNLSSTSTVSENSQPQNINPRLQSASSIPANLQTKSISVHGNSVIMQGVIDTGMAQTSCFLIPIDIGNIGQLPSGVQVIQSSPNQMMGTQHQVLNTQTSQNVGNSPVLIPINQQPHQNISQQQHQQQHQQQQQQQHPQFLPLNLSVHNTTNNINTFANGGHGLTTSTANKPGSVNGSCDKVPPFKGATRSTSSNSSVTVTNSSQGRPLTSAPRIIEEEISVTNQSTDSVEVSVADKAHIINSSANKKSPNGNDATSAQVDAVVDALQSTDSLSQMLDQLSHDDMVSIISILTNSPTPVPSSNPGAASSSDNLSTDLAKLASDIDKISKLDPDQLSNGVVNQLAAEISKLLSSTAAPVAPEGGPDKLLSKLLDTAIQEEDEDFQHVQIIQAQQTTEEVNTNAGLKCYMCGLVCPDERAFITHMRFHLFNYRYSCYECGFGTSSMNELLLHKAEQHEGDLTKISPELLKELPKSERAAMPDLEETLIQCPECKENIPLNSLSGHMNQKHKPLHKASPGRKPKCTICTALVENKLELAAHVKHHGKEDNCFACYFCAQTYTSISSLQLHTTNYHASLAARRHYKCTQCAREFSGSYHLIRHVKTVHEQRRDYQCSKCDKSFVELHCLRRHIRNIHNLIRDHTCPVCNRGFTYRQDMFRHIMSVHQKIRDIKCPLCSEKFYHRYFIGHAYRQHDLKVKYRDGICYIYDDAGNVIHKIT